MEAKDLVELIRKRYSGGNFGTPKYAILEQVPNGTGFSPHWIDVAVFSLWPSTGLGRSAFEIKISTSDFRRELQDPMKYEWVRKSFHEFWYVAPKGIINVDELPNGAGLMVPYGKGLSIKKHCKRNDNPILDDALLAGFMRAASQEVVKQQQRGGKEALEGSPEFKRARIYEEAMNAFCMSRREYGPFDQKEVTQEEVIERLKRATMDEQLKKDLRHIDSVLDDFESKMVHLFGIFGLLASASITAKNEAGEYIVKTFGTFSDNLSHLMSKDRPVSKMGKMMREREKDYKDMLGIIARFGKLDD